jgi:ABC-type molybdate transport system ATPase subunit
MTRMTTIQARFQLDYGDFKLAGDLKLPGSGISVLFGHSGSGKTTLLRCIAGLQRAPQGYLEIFGRIASAACFCPPINGLWAMYFRKLICFRI